MEIETEDSPKSPADLYEWFIDLAGYLLEKGPVFKDGDTVGEDAKHQIQVVHARSAFGHDGEVIRLEHTTKPKKSWVQEEVAASPGT